MAEKRFICDLDLDGNRLLNALLHPSYDAPENPEAGQVYFDIEEKKLFFFGGDVWRTFATPEDIADFNALIKDTQSTVARAFGQDRWSNLSGPLRMNVVSGTLRLTVGGNYVCSVPIGDIIPDALISSATLVTVAEQGITIPVPYIKIVFDSTAGSQVVRFSVKDLIDVYDGANLKLSDAYAPMEGTVLPGDSMDIAIGKLSRAVEKGGEGVLIAVYGETPYRDVTEAFSRDMAVFCLDGENMFSLTKDDGVDKVLFARQEGGKTEYAQVDIHDEWTRWEESASVPDNVVLFEDNFVIADTVFLDGHVEGDTLCLPTRIAGIKNDTLYISNNEEDNE